MKFKQIAWKQGIKKSALIFVCVFITLAALLAQAATAEKNLRFDSIFHIKLMANNAANTTAPAEVFAMAKVSGGITPQ